MTELGALTPTADQTPWIDRLQRDAGTAAKHRSHRSRWPRRADLWRYRFERPADGVAHLVSATLHIAI